MKNLVLICILLMNTCSFAQIYSANSYLTDFNGTMVKPSNDNRVMGTPYLVDEWCKGQITNTDGKQFELEKMKFNVFQNRIEYEIKGNVYEPAIPYRSFKISQPNGDGTFQTRSFTAGFSPIDGNDTRTFYEVIYNGNAKLLKLIKVVTSEYAEPLSINRVLRFRQVFSLYFFHPEKRELIKVGTKRDEIIPLFIGKEQEMREFIKKEKTKRNVNEADLVILCKYYDDLL
ncbi:MAG: hypothetical protein ACKO1F_16545 [Flammeovirgaceae bacterium]